MALFSAQTKHNLLVGWHLGDNAFADAVRVEILSGRIEAKIGEKLIIGRHTDPPRALKRIQLGRW